jgi:hypothetical protein
MRVRDLPLKFVRRRAVSGETPAYLKAVRIHRPGRHGVRPNAAAFVRVLHHGPGSWFRIYILTCTAHY